MRDGDKETMSGSSKLAISQNTGGSHWKRTAVNRIRYSENRCMRLKHLKRLTRALKKRNYVFGLRIKFQYCSVWEKSVTQKNMIEINEHIRNRTWTGTARLPAQQVFHRWGLPSERVIEAHHLFTVWRSWFEMIPFCVLPVANDSVVSAVRTIPENIIRFRFESRLNWPGAILYPARQFNIVEHFWCCLGGYINNDG